MSQSAVLVASLVAAFVLYVAASGRLAAYSTALLGAAPAGGGDGKGGGQKPDPSAVSDPGSWVKAGENLAQYL